MRKIRTLIAAAALVLLALLGACGSTGNAKAKVGSTTTAPSQGGGSYYP